MVCFPPALTPRRTSLMASASTPSPLPATVLRALCVVGVLTQDTHETQCIAVGVSACGEAERAGKLLR